MQCIICQREYTYNKIKGHTKTKCNSCLVNQRRFSKKKKCIEYKGGACQICGYDRCERSLAFHHLDPAQKDFNVSGNHTRSWQVLKEELNKCILVCHNCHGEIHEGIIQPVV